MERLYCLYGLWGSLHEYRRNQICISPQNRRSQARRNPPFVTPVSCWAYHTVALEILESLKDNVTVLERPHHLLDIALQQHDPHEFQWPKSPPDLHPRTPSSNPSPRFQPVRPVSLHGSGRLEWAFTRGRYHLPPARVCYLKEKLILYQEVILFSDINPCPLPPRRLRRPSSPHQPLKVPSSAPFTHTHDRSPLSAGDCLSHDPRGESCLMICSVSDPRGTPIPDVGD